MSQNSSLINKWLGRSTQSFVPLQASLELTYRCNERCSHCYIEKFWDDPKRKLQLEDWYKILSELKAAGTLYIILMGGEAMLNPHFWQISQRASELGFHTSMITNGIKISSLQVAKKLKASGILAATFSVYSLDENIHDKATGVKGSLQKTLRAIEFCQEAEVEVHINSLITKNNVYKIFSLEDWAVKNGFDCKIDPIITPKLNGDKSPTLLRATPEQLRWYYKQKSKRWQKGNPKPNGTGPNDFVCNAAKGKCAISPYGELLACIELRTPLGNLTQQSFAEAWNSAEALKWRHITNADVQGLTDSSCASFCDHCPGMAKNEQGDYLSVTEFDRQHAQVKQQIYNERKDEFQ